jgi:hypothetical protein
MVITSLEDLVRAIGAAVADCMEARDQALVSQRDPRGLRGRRHIEAVRRRVAEQTRSGAERDAFIRDRDYLLTPAAVRDELARETALALAARNDNAGPERPRTAKAKAKSAAAAERDEMARLKRELEADMRAARGR